MTRISITRNVLGFILGAGLGLALPAGLSAQTAPKVRIEPGLAACWDQPAAALPTTQTMKVRVTYDAGSPIDTPFTCTGTSSPFTCQGSQPAPATVMVPGVHTFKVEGATIDPLDGTLSSWNVLVLFQADLYTLTPPQPGSNGRLVKLLGYIASALGAFWLWLT